MIQRAAQAAASHTFNEAALIVSQTANRKWINYEIGKAWDDKKELLGIYIHRLPNQDGKALINDTMLQWQPVPNRSPRKHVPSEWPFATCDGVIVRGNLQVTIKRN